MKPRKFFSVILCLALVAVLSSCGSDNEGGNWSVQEIDRLDFWSMGGPSSIACGLANTVHILYSDNETREVRYKTNSGGSWQSDIIDTDVWNNSCASVVVDTSGNVHAVYLDAATTAGGSLKYATNAVGGWTTQLVDGAAGNYCDIELDSRGNVHIGYSLRSPYGIRHAISTSGMWNTATVYTSGGSIFDSVSMELDSRDNVHLAFYESGFPDKLTNLTNSAGFWNAVTVESEGTGGPYSRRANVVVDSKDNLYIGYNLDDGILKYAAIYPDRREHHTLGGTAGQNPALAIDAHDNLHMSAYSASNFDLIYLTSGSGSWKVEHADKNENAGDRSSIAVDSNGKVHISYWQYVYGNHVKVKYAANR